MCRNSFLSDVIGYGVSTLVFATLSVFLLFGILVVSPKTSPPPQTASSAEVSFSPNNQVSRAAQLTSEASQRYPVAPSRTPPAAQIHAHILLKNFPFIYVQASPSLDAQEVDRVYNPTQHFGVIGFSPDKGWLRVQLDSGKLGWIKREFVVPDDAAQTLDALSVVTP